MKSLKNRNTLPVQYKYTTARCANQVWNSLIVREVLILEVRPITGRLACFHWLSFSVSIAHWPISSLRSNKKLLTHHTVHHLRHHPLSCSWEGVLPTWITRKKTHCGELIRLAEREKENPECCLSAFPLGVAFCSILYMR